MKYIDLSQSQHDNTGNGREYLHCIVSFSVILKATNNVYKK
jgi:hypothetical protein